MPKLVSEILNEGYKLFVDNWNSSLYLLNSLYNNDTVRCGNARSNCVQLLKSFNTPSKDQFTYPQNDKLLAVSYLGKKEIFFYPLCTIYKTFLLEKGIKIWSHLQSSSLSTIITNTWVVQIKAMLWSAVALASKKLTSVPEIFFSITLNR